VHLVGFIIRIYHDARSPERQIIGNCVDVSADCHVLCANNGISDVKIIKVICQMRKIIDFKTSAWLFFFSGTS